MYSAEHTVAFLCALFFSTLSAKDRARVRAYLRRRRAIRKVKRSKKQHVMRRERAQVRKEDFDIRHRALFTLSDTTRKPDARAIKRAPFTCAAARFKERAHFTTGTLLELSDKRKAIFVGNVLLFASIAFSRRVLFGMRRMLILFSYG